jgi:hypothetical protein
LQGLRYFYRTHREPRHELQWGRANHPGASRDDEMTRMGRPHRARWAAGAPIPPRLRPGVRCARVCSSTRSVGTPALACSLWLSSTAIIVYSIRRFYCTAVYPLLLSLIRRSAPCYIRIFSGLLQQSDPFSSSYVSSPSTASWNVVHITVFMFMRASTGADHRPHVHCGCVHYHRKSGNSHAHCQPSGC